MYLRRFAEHRGRRDYELTARRMSSIDRPFPVAPTNVLVERGYYWGIDPSGTPHHFAEDLLSSLEAAAAPALTSMLDDADGALPSRWPLPPSGRIALAWWMAAQILRTTRQRKRVEHFSVSERLIAPRKFAALMANNAHLEYISANISALAFILHARPWGLGFTDFCMLTSDVPVVLLNGHDAKDQLAAAAICDIMLPLDPHRILFLPSPHMQLRDPGKRIDHRMKIDGGVGTLFVQAAYDVADTVVLHHPRHDPWRHWQPDGPRQPAVWNGEEHPGPEYILEYPTLPSHLTVARRWLTEHPPPRTASADQKSSSM
jgi:hypothetical protein